MIDRRKFLAAAGTTAISALISNKASANTTETKETQPIQKSDAGEKTALHNRPGMKIDTSPGKHVLEFDMPGLEIGCAIYPDGPTGCTVFNFPDVAVASCDIRGGSPGTISTDATRDGAGWINSICFAGGSIYGLQAVCGVANELFKRTGYSGDWRDIKGATGAIIYDFRGRDIGIIPDLELGAAALRAAVPGKFPMGARGAGVNASCGKLLLPKYESELAGQGGAFCQESAHSSLPD